MKKANLYLFKSIFFSTFAPDLGAGAYLPIIKKF